MEEPEEGEAELTEAVRSAGTGKRGKRVWLVCGTTNMYTGLDGLLAIIDGSGTMLKYIKWDGMGFQQGKRRAQSGSYPWIKGEAGEMVEINEKEFAYLLSRSIVPFKEK